MPEGIRGWRFYLDGMIAFGEKVLAHFALNHPGPASFPSISLRILELVRYPDVNLNELAKYIRMDGALASSLLSLANSAVYRGVKHIDTVKDAVARIGLGEVRGTVRPSPTT